MECPNNPQLFNETDTTVLSILTALHEFRMFYRTLHKYVSMLLCLFGLVANCTHIWILTRPQMLRSSVHAVLICIALADIGTMSSYAIYLLRYEFGANSSGGYSYGWVLLLKIHVVLSIALHAISLYLLVFMAFIRLRSIQTRHSRLLENRVARIISLLIALVIFTLCIPTLLAHDIQPQKQDSQFIKSKTVLSTDSTVSDPGSVSTKYSIGFSKMFINNECFLLKLNLWLIGIMMKVVPCILLLCLTYCLLVKLEENRKKRMVLLRDKSKDGVFKDRTTYMLLLMVSVFLCTELPQGIIAIFNAIYTAQFHFYVYLTIADVLDVLSLINCYVGFTVYFCTCSRYRQTFYAILPRFRDHTKKPQQTEKQQETRTSVVERRIIGSKELLSVKKDQETEKFGAVTTTNGPVEDNDCLL